MAQGGWAMKIDVKLEGATELAETLRKLPTALSYQVQIGALRAAAEPIRVEAEMRAPRDDDAASPHLDENIVAGPITQGRMEARGRQDEAVVEVGPRGGKSGDDFFYGYMQEYGTARHAAQPFMRPAFDAEASTALEILMDELWWSIRRGIPAGKEKFVA